jgi:4-amino-4-deoxy-L-arabinose transferase-like glycosyltransferase
MTLRKQLGIIFFVGLVLFFLGNRDLWITDPVESNYALTAKEMLLSGDYISPRIYGSYWYDKPVFFYWELIAAFKLFGINEFAARFFPALFGMVGLFVTYFFAKRMYDAKTGFASAIILATSLEYWLLSKTIITDMTLFVFSNAVLIFFYLAYTGEKKVYYYLCYVFAALAVLTKGPIGILLPGFILVLFILWKRQFAEVKKMKFFSGMLLFFIIAGSWYYMMYGLHGEIFISTFLGVHNMLRATVSEHPTFNVWYYYLAIFIIGFFPWVFTVPLVLKKYWQAKKWPEIDEKTGFLLIWAITIAVFYQCMATKYPTYSFPYMLPLSILAARCLRNHEKLFKVVAAVTAGVYIILLFTVAIPYCQQRSAKEAGEALAELNVGNNVVVSFGDYRTSAVFYSNQEIYRLEKKANIEALKPKEMSWDSKNVMPFLDEERLANEKEVWALCGKDQAERFLTENAEGWNLVQKYKKIYIFQKK